MSQNPRGGRGDSSRSPRAGQGPARREAAGNRGFQALLRILDLEEKLGFTDSAVMGGMDRFLEAQRADLAETAPPPRPYAALSVAERRAWASEVRKSTGSAASPEPAQSPGGRRGNEGERSSARPSAGSHTRRGAGTEGVTLETPVEKLPFIGKQTAPRLRRLGMDRLRDLVHHYPRRHIDYTNITQIAYLEVETDATVDVKVLQSGVARIGPPPGAAKLTVSDGTGIAEVTFFRQAYLAEQIKPGARMAISGRVSEFKGRAQFQNPEHQVIRGGEPLVHAGNLLPVYPSIEGLPQRTLRNAISRALAAGVPLSNEFLPEGIRARNELLDYQDALHAIHLPQSMEQYESARRRLAFDELFLNQIAVQQRKLEWRARGGGVPVSSGEDALHGFLGSLDFSLTDDQKEALRATLEDMAGDAPMGRLLQGEVGSGKTVVAVAALLATAASGLQGALLAPTEVLAEQHFLSLRQLLNASPMPDDQGASHPQDPEADKNGEVDSGGSASSPVLPATVPGFAGPVRVALLTGSQTQRTKADIRELIASGEADIVVGTHALIQESVQFPRLGLAVVDEQHRFGVEQRAALSRAEPRPHLLGMSATPIPRSLALTLYGDLDLSTLRQLPGGRQPVTTTWARCSREREEAYELVRSEVADGRQAFVVCPIIEESEKVATRSAVEEYELLRNSQFKDLRLGLLHGRMPIAEKQSVMEQFRAGEIDVLVATQVIEVGIDIPNATVMMIEGAERFGLSQMHQLRGRVGRGQHKSYCLLLSDNPSQEARTRLSILERVSDGFDLAEEDLGLRGPGDYIGTRQSGFEELQVATLSDMDILSAAREEARSLVASDPALKKREHEQLAAALREYLSGRTAEFS